MKITKTQIDYLRRRLDEISEDKCKDFRTKHPRLTDNERWEILYDAIKSGKAPLKTKKEVLAEPSKWHTPSLNQLFNISKYNELDEDIEKSYDDYRTKLQKAKTAIMDRVVLSDLMIEDAVKEFMKL